MPVDTYDAALCKMVEVLIGEFDDADNDPPILWPNVPADEPVDQLWMRMTMLPGTPFRVTIRGSKSRFRNPGVLALQLFGKSEAGDSPVLQLIDRLVPVLRSKNFDGLCFLEPEPTRIGVTAKALQYNLNTPFRFDSIGTTT